MGNMESLYIKGMYCFYGKNERIYYDRADYR